MFKSSNAWIGGNRFDLLENGEDYFPRVFDAIRQARTEVLIETFILFEDKVGKALHEVLCEAGRRGVRVDLTVDGFGSADLTEEFMQGLLDAGVHLHIFDPGSPALRKVTYFRRLHRKLVVVDGQIGFIGGINFSADHLMDFGPEAKEDFSIEVRGPVVLEMQRFMHDALGEFAPRNKRHAQEPDSANPSRFSRQPSGDGQALLVQRNNRRHRSDIEHQYRLAIRMARKRVVIANAYFFPGYRFLRTLRRAARRGVEVTLILQGNPDMGFVQTAASLLYHHLAKAGVRIQEYCERPFHGKVALIDDEWCTVGSSNLDPLSLALNLEANLFIRDRSLNQALYERLQTLTRHCKVIRKEDLPRSNWWRNLRSFIVFHLLRHYPAWAGALPGHAPTLRSPAVSKLGSQKWNTAPKEPA